MYFNRLALMLAGAAAFARQKPPRDESGFAGRGESNA